MARSSARGGTRLPTPLVLALASAMVCVGIVAIYLAQSDEGPAQEGALAGGRPGVSVDTSTPALAAESFLDAWRKRNHGIAMDLSVGRARGAVLARQEADERLTPEELEVREGVWDHMADSRLTLQIDQSEELDDGRVRLMATAEGSFLDRPYRREMGFTLRERHDGWVVEHMELGEILTETPDFLDLDPDVGRDPSEFEIRGEDVP